MKTETTRLPKAAITRLLHRAQLAEFTTQQFNDRVLLTCNTADLEYFEHALEVAGFATYFVRINKHNKRTSITYGLDVCSLDEYTSEKISLMISIPWSQQQVDEFIAAAAAATAKAGA